MCYSEAQSQKSFIINLVTCYVLYTYKSNSPTHKILALFLGFVGLMQLFDLIFWKNQNIKDPYQANVNYTTTKIAMFANHLQPIILAYLIYSFTGSLGTVSKLLLPIYVVVISLYTIQSYKNINYTVQESVSIRDLNDLLFPEPKDDSVRTTLKWEWNKQKNSLFVYILFLITLLVLAYENFKYPINIVLIFINLFTFILSAYYHKGQSLGRFWCKFAAWVPLFFIVISNVIET
jgi:hypothetical protein